jgi:hypothetical protein
VPASIFTPLMFVSLVQTRETALKTFGYKLDGISRHFLFNKPNHLHLADLLDLKLVAKRFYLRLETYNAPIG